MRLSLCEGNHKGRSDDLINVYGSNYFIHQFDDIFTDTLGYVPRYKIGVTPPEESPAGYTIISITLPAETSKFEDAMKKEILGLESMEFYEKRGFLAIKFNYDDGLDFDGDKRKMSRK